MLMRQSKIDNFSLTRFLVKKLVLPIFQQGNLLMCTAVLEKFSNEHIKLARVASKKFVKEIYSSFTRASRILKKLVKEKLLVCAGINIYVIQIYKGVNM